MNKARVLKTILCSRLVAPCLIVTLIIANGPSVSSQEVDFARDIQPIFAKNCVACHGPDDAEGGLRLTEKDSAFGELDSGELGIVPGDADASELVRRIAAEDESERMPPEGKPLSEAQVQLIRKWIDDGANWSKHWAFEPPVAKEPPTTENQSWSKNPIDQFILAELEQKSLSPNPPAADSELIRRAYYDLTGLPPTPEEVAKYVAIRWQRFLRPASRPN